jgi:hypothetical protein
MAVAMDKAFSQTLEKIIVPTDVSMDESLRKGLLCIDCNIDITFRKEHERNKRIIPAGFIRKKGIEHKATCRYNTLGQVTIIAQDSDDNVLKSINDSKFSLRLTLIHKSLNQVANNSPKHKMEQFNTTINQERNYQTKGNLSSYLATMRKIIELRNILEDKNELHPIVEVSCHNKKVKWESFYFEPERYFNAHKYLKELKWEERHPICIEGIIHDIPYIEKLGKYVINLQWGKTKFNSEGIKYIPTVSVLLNDKELMKLGFQKGQRIALCSLCTQGISKGKGTGREFFNIKAELYHKNQVAIL